MLRKNTIDVIDVVTVLYIPNPLPMIYELKRMSTEELQNLYIRETNKLMTGVSLNISHNSLQSLRLNVFHLDRELQRRQGLRRFQRA